MIVHGAKGAPELQLWQGGDWTMSWSQWQKGSALQLTGRPNALYRLPADRSA